MSRFLCLSRPRTNTAFIPELDGLRFIAISLVVLHHNHFVLRDGLPDPANEGGLWLLYSALAEAGGLGVPLFFIISGIVLGIPFAKARIDGGPKVSLRLYFKRRLRRLEPPYIINLTLLFLLATSMGGAEVFLERLPHYLASLLYLHNTIYNAWSEINFVAWSLEVEAQFYLLAPVLAAVFLLSPARFRGLTIVALICAMSLISMLAQDWSFRYTNSILALGQYFLAGFLMADLLVTRRLYAPKPSAFYDLVAVGLFCVAVAFKLGVPYPQAQALGVIPLGLFFIAIFRGHFILAALRWPPIFTIGGMCYTIYLYHFWIIQAPVRAFDMGARSYQPLEVIIFDITMSAIVFLASAVLFVLFERPFMNRKAKSVQ